MNGSRKKAITDRLPKGEMNLLRMKTPRVQAKQMVQVDDVMVAEAVMMMQVLMMMPTESRPN